MRRCGGSEWIGASGSLSVVKGDQMTRGSTLSLLLVHGPFLNFKRKMSRWMDDCQRKAGGLRR